MVLLIPLSIAAWTCLVVIFFTTVRIPFPNTIVLLLSVVFAAPFLVRCAGAYRAAKRRFTTLEREYPAFIAQLRLLQPGEAREPVARTGIPMR
jgi:hypothetical protein